MSIMRLMRPAICHSWRGAVLSGSRGFIGSGRMRFNRCYHQSHVVVLCAYCLGKPSRFPGSTNRAVRSAKPRPRMRPQFPRAGWSAAHTTIPFLASAINLPSAGSSARTKCRRDDSGSQPKDPKAQVLLAVFERPPEAMGDTVNSAVVIASESEKSYPGLKSAVDYFGPLEEVTKSKGFQVTNQPYEFSVGAKKNRPRRFQQKSRQAHHGSVHAGHACRKDACCLLPSSAAAKTRSRALLPV